MFDARLRVRLQELTSRPARKKPARPGQGGVGARAVGLRTGRPDPPPTDRSDRPAGLSHFLEPDGATRNRKIRQVPEIPMILKTSKNLPGRGAQRRSPSSTNPMDPSRPWYHLTLPGTTDFPAFGGRPPKDPHTDMLQFYWARNEHFRDCPTDGRANTEGA